MSQNILQPNEDKTEVIIFGAKAQREQISVHLKSLGLHTKNHVKNFDVILDSDLRFDTHIRNVTKISFYPLRRTEHFFRRLTQKH